MNSNLHVATEKSVYKPSGLIRIYTRDSRGTLSTHILFRISPNIVLSGADVYLYPHRRDKYLPTEISRARDTSRYAAEESVDVVYLQLSRVACSARYSTALQIEYVTTLS